MAIDVWFALEAYESAIHKRFDVSVLVAGDGDFLPLVRKLNTLGTRVMLLAWDFKYMDAQEEERETRTSQSLLDEVTYPVMMHHVIDDRSKRNDPLVSGLFVRPKENRLATPSSSMNVHTETNDQNHGTIQNLKSGFGFIAPHTGGTNLFFHFTEVLNADFNDLRVGAPVIYRLGRNDRGTCAVQVQA